MWKTRQKQLGGEQINGHVAKPYKLIVNWTRKNIKALNTPCELYGAMLQQGKDGPVRGEGSG